MNDFLLNVEVFGGGDGGGGGGGIPEAPSDGKIYGRKNASWAEVQTGGVTDVATVYSELTTDPAANGTPHFAQVSLNSADINEHIEVIKLNVHEPEITEIDVGVTSITGVGTIYIYLANDTDLTFAIYNGGTLETDVQIGAGTNLIIIQNDITGDWHIGVIPITGDFVRRNSAAPQLLDTSLTLNDGYQIFGSVNGDIKSLIGIGEYITLTSSSKYLGRSYGIPLTDTQIQANSALLDPYVGTAYYRKVLLTTDGMYYYQDGQGGFTRSDGSDFTYETQTEFGTETLRANINVNYFDYLTAETPTEKVKIATQKDIDKCVKRNVNYINRTDYQVQVPLHPVKGQCRRLHYQFYGSSGRCNYKISIRSLWGDNYDIYTSDYNGSTYQFLYCNIMKSSPTNQRLNNCKAVWLVTDTGTIELWLQTSAGSMPSYHDIGVTVEQFCTGGGVSVDITANQDALPAAGSAATAGTGQSLGNYARMWASPEFGTLAMGLNEVPVSAFATTW